MQSKYISLIYGVIAAIISFIAVFFLALRTFHLKSSLAIMLAFAGAVLFFAWAYYQAYASEEIKRISAKFHLTDQDLAQITGLSVQNFPVYHNRLQLVLPKRYLPVVLKKLRRLEKERDYAQRK